MAGEPNDSCHLDDVAACACSFYIFTDYMRGAMRMSALSEAGVIYVMTHDSIGLGEDGPTHQVLFPTIRQSFNFCICVSAVACPGVQMQSFTCMYVGSCSAPTIACVAFRTACHTECVCG